MKPMLKNWSKYFSLIGIGLFIYILSKADLNSFLLLLQETRYSFLFLLPVFTFLIFFVQTLKWQQLLKIQKLDYDFWYLFKVHIISNYYALLTPSRIGYFVKIGYLNNSFGVASASVVIDRILDTLVLSIFASIGAFLLISQFPNLIFQISVFVFVFIIAVLFFYSRKRAKFLFGFFKRIIPGKFQEPLKRVFHDFYDNLPRRRKLWSPFLLTILTWFLIYSQSYLIAQALNLSINFWYYIFFFSIATVVSLIPITVSGLGTREAALILLLSQFNVSIESIVALSLMGLILAGYLPALIGVFLSFKLKKHGP